jgi:hypothetical protein
MLASAGLAVLSTMLNDLLPKTQAGEEWYAEDKSDLAVHVWLEKPAP